MPTLEALEQQVAHLAAEVVYLREKLSAVAVVVDGHRDQIHLLANRFNELVLREERDRLLKEKKG